MSSTSRATRRFDVLDARDADGEPLPGRYPRALYYPDDGALILFPRGRNLHTLRMRVDNLVQTADGRVAALGVVGTLVVLAPARRQRRARRKLP